MSDYTATIPAGQVGLWCSDNSDNDLDDYKVQDIAGPFETDGRWFSNTGDVRVENRALDTTLGAEPRDALRPPPLRGGRRVKGRPTTSWRPMAATMAGARSSAAASGPTSWVAPASRRSTRSGRRGRLPHCCKFNP